MKKFLLGWLARGSAFAAIAGVASVIRWQHPLLGVAMAVGFGAVARSLWRQRNAPKAPVAPPERRPWER